MRNNDWNDWYAFLQVAALGSFTRAAERMEQPKSTLSVAVRRLEQRLGQRLLERSTRRLELTDAGARLLEQARPLFERLDELTREAVAATDRPRGVLRLATPYEFGSLQLGDVVCEVMTRYPDLEIEIDITPGDALQSFSDYDIQFVITSQDLPDSKHVARRIFTVPRALYAAPALLERLGDPTAPAELERWPCLSGRNENAWQFIDGAGETLSVRPHIVLRTANAAMRVQAACAGLGAALLVDSFCQAEVEAGRLVPILKAYRALPRRIYAYLSDRRLMPAKTRVFMQALEQTLIIENE